MHRKRRNRALEGRLVTEEYICDYRRRNGREEQRQDGAHRNVEEQDLKGEKDTGKRSLEYTGNRTGCAAAQENGHILI